MRMAECHPDKRHVAFGMCKTCYSSHSYSMNKEKHRAKAAAFRQKHRARLNEEDKARYYRNPEMRGRLGRACRRYGLTPDQFKEMMANGCAICKQELRAGNGSMSAHVDHDHQTGRLRGIVCNYCNVYGLVWFERHFDKPDIIARAVAYVASSGHGN